MKRSLTALLLCFFLVACATNRGNPPQGGLELKAQRRVEKKPGREYVVEYPAFPGFPALNEAILSIVDKEIGDFSARSEENLRAWEETATAEEKARRKQAHELLVRWRGESLCEDRISFLLEAYAYVGGAHGETRLYGINYDPLRRRFLELQDVIENKPPDWLEILAREARLRLVGILGDGSFSTAMLEQGTAPLPGNFSCFTFDDSSVTIHFQRYQVAPGSAGTPSLVLPRDMDALGR